MTIEGGGGVGRGSSQTIACPETGVNFYIIVCVVYTKLLAIVLERAADCRLLHGA